MIPIYQLPEADRMTEAQIKKAVSWKQSQNISITSADNYYMGKNDAIMASEHSHKIPVPYGRKLIKSVLGFMFKEGYITYSWPDDWGDFKKTMDDVFSFNDEETENVRLGRDQAKYGSAYEILFVDNQDARPQFYRVPAYQVIPVYTYGIKPKMWAAVNHYKVSTVTHIEVYYSDRIEHFQLEDDAYRLVSTIAHQFGEVPVVEYRNNEEGMGDIESITALIDAHDEILANGLDEDSKFADAVMLLKNTNLDDEAIDQLIRLRVLSIDEDGEASYLTKPDTNAGREILRKVIEGLIFSMSGIPNLDDKDAMAQQSGEALKYLYATFEIMVAGDKQSGFTDGLMRRLRLINSFLTWLGQSRHTTDSISIQWKRNLPAEGTTLIDNVVKVTGMVSRKTMLEQLHKAGIVDNVAKEEDRLKNEASIAKVDLIKTEDIEESYE